MPQAFDFQFTNNSFSPNDISEATIVPTTVQPLAAFHSSAGVFASVHSPHIVCDFSQRSVPSNDDVSTLPEKSLYRTMFENFESTLIRVSDNCPINFCWSGKCSKRSNSSCDCNEPLLTSAAYGAAVSSESSQLETDPVEVERLNTEVVNWMRRRLTYFFMTPVEKYYAKGRFPYKLLTQFFKVIVVTLQLIVFGMDHSSHIYFGDASRLAFCHLYLRNWDVQYETLEYPPAAGPYAVYTKSDFFLNVGYAISNYNRTRELAIGEYSFTSSNPYLDLCQTNLLDITGGLNVSISEAEEQSCIRLYPLEIDAKSLSNAESVEQFLVSQNLSIDFSRLLLFTLRFSLLSPVVTNLGPPHLPECFRFDVIVDMEKVYQSGLIAIHLRAPYAVAPCDSMNDSGLMPESLSHQDARIIRLQSFWSQFNETVPHGGFVTWRSLSVLRMLIPSLQIAALLLGIISLILCIRSVARNFIMWKETIIFFKHWYSLELYGYFWHFIPPWFMAIIANDVMIIVGSSYNLWATTKLHYKPEPISYVLGISALLVWSGILRYIGFSYPNSILMRTIIHSIPALLRFGVCSLILFFAFTLCGWIVLGPYNIKFRSFISTLECLYSLINGDDMFATFSAIGDRSPWGIFIFSRLFLYVFITLFIYVVLNLFITIIFEAYEDVKRQRDTFGRPLNSPLYTFIRQNRHSCRSVRYKQDDNRADRKLLHCLALGRHFAAASTTVHDPVGCESAKEISVYKTMNRRANQQPVVDDESLLNNPSQLTSAGSSSVSFVSQQSSAPGPEESEQRSTSTGLGRTRAKCYDTSVPLHLQRTVYDALSSEMEIGNFDER